MDRIWTPEDRDRQAAVLKRVKIWEHSTGPKTDEGKGVSKMNALKHGCRSQAFIELKKVVKDQKNLLESNSSLPEYIS